MFARLKNWLNDRFSTAEPSPLVPPGKTGQHTAVRPEKAPVRKSAADIISDENPLSGTIEDGGPNKNVLIRNKYVREDTGTHETLKILDDSLVDSGEEPGIDPYNTGGFDRSKNWNNRFRK